MKVLIVDDKDDARYLLEMILQSAAHQVVSAKNGRQAVDNLKSASFDLIISDILMPEMDGFQLCKIVKSSSEWQSIPFIFYTATYLDKKDEEFAHSLGADLFLQKPLPPDKFMGKVHDLFDSIENRRYQPQTINLENEKEVYKLYSERLVTKLERKIDQLNEEIKKRSETELKLRKLLQEREILLRELYHRTRNNMQVISSMLKIYTKRVNNPKWDRVISNINGKIRATALVHQKLYESQDLTHLDLKDYIESLIKHFREPLAGKNISIKLDLQKIYVLLDTAIPMGFILNELISNSIEHAFNGSKAGKIEIDLQGAGEKGIELVVRDDGCGLPSGFNLNSEVNWGLSIIQSMVRDQLKGKIDFTNDNGFVCRIILEKEYYSKRV